MYIHYKNHQESVMCVEGEAEVEVNILLSASISGFVTLIELGFVFL